MYIVGAWVAVQVAGMLFPAINVPEEALLYVWLIAVSLFPLVVVFSWRYDVSIEGITRTPPAQPGEDFNPALRKFDVVLLTALGVVALSVLLQFGTQIETGAVRLGDSISRFSIAVLPFDDLSGNPDEQYFVSGMQSSLIDGLSRVRNLRVTSKVSTLPFRQSGGSLIDVALKLGVARIVEGTVLRNGGRVSIALRMHDAERDEQVWSARFEDDLENIMFIQARAVQEIANQVRVQLGPEEREHFASARPVNAEAYNAYLKGVFHVERFNPEDIRIAATHFERAVKIDPEFALGHWGLGKHCLFEAQIGMLTPEQAQKQCLPPVLKALELDPFLPEAYFGLAGILTWHQYDWDGARPQWERALELNPSYAEAHIFYSHYLGIVGELEKSTEHADKAIALDPHNPFTMGLYAVQLIMRREYEKALDVAEKALSMAPGYAFGYAALWRAHYDLGHEEETIQVFANIMRNMYGNPEVADTFESTFREDGFKGALLWQAERQSRRTESDNVPAMDVVVFYALGGDYESAIDWMEIAVERSDPNAPYLGVLTRTPGIRAHPRFIALLRRMGLDYWAANP
jgi:TolB-like protein/Tfp pilus assembly protein PilF